MRIRTIKPEFFKHEELFDAEAETGLPLRLAFTGLWCAADREGRFLWRPRALKSDILPFDEIDFSRVLDALVTRGFVVRYASGSREFGVIPSFHRHQVVNNRERESELPDPPETLLNTGVPTRAPRVDDACPTRQVHAQAEHGTRNMEQGTGNREHKEKDSAREKPEPQKPTKRKAVRKPVEDPDQCALGALFSKRSGHLWRPEDLQRFRDASPTSDEVRLVVRYYRADLRDDSQLRYRRKSLETLLNNWTAEVGKAEQFDADPEFHLKPKTQRKGKDQEQW